MLYRTMTGTVPLELFTASVFIDLSIVYLQAQNYALYISWIQTYITQYDLLIENIVVRIGPA